MTHHDKDLDHDAEHWAVTLILFPLLIIVAIIAVLFKLDPDG